MVLLEQRAVIAGKYRLERELARGGMGAVWVARHLQLDIDVAMKFMGPEFASSSEARGRFEREARASAKLRSPHVVHMLDHGAAEDGTLFLAMELLQGEDLNARLARSGRLTPSAMSPLVDQVCKALECAHDAGIVHRDLKPANIFLARQGREEMVKVLDFGIAKIMDPALASKVTKTGTLLGTPYYMSPEQVRRSKAVDPRSDLWSLGVILFQCLTGRVPFAGEELGDVLVAICSDEIPLASQLVPELGPGVDGFLRRALTRDPAQRFQSARELAEAFADVVHATGGPPEAYGRPPAPSAPREASAPFLLHPAASVAFIPHAGMAATAPQPPVAAIGTLPAGAAPHQEFASLPGTLSPASATLAPPRSRQRLMIAAVLGGVLVLGLGLVGVVLNLRGPQMSVSVASNAPAEEPSARPLPIDSAPSPPSAAVPQTTASAVDAAPSVDVPASSSARGSHSSPAAVLQPSKKVPVPGKPAGQPHHDPLEHR